MDWGKCPAVESVPRKLGASLGIPREPGACSALFGNLAATRGKPSRSSWTGFMEWRNGR